MAAHYDRGLCLIYDVDKAEVVVKPFRCLLTYDMAHAQLECEQFDTKNFFSKEEFQKLDLMNVRKCYVYKSSDDDIKRLRILMPTEMGQKSDKFIMLKDYGQPDLKKDFELQVMFAAAKSKGTGRLKI